MQPTARVYLEDEHCTETGATLVGVRDGQLAFDRSLFYPGGGGQPPDFGSLALPDGTALQIVAVHADEDGVIWHQIAGELPAIAPGATVRLKIDAARRHALTRYHTVLHVLNTITLRDYGGWITGAQIATDYSRIDFKLEGLSAALCAELELKVNAVLAAGRRLTAGYISEAEFARRPELLRTLDARPPVVDGRVRVVEIAGFDAQACGGTHVGNTAEVGRFSIVRTGNKGRINKRLYVRLDAVPAA
jgi:misacylated tRNA(Ala) deacylase